MFIATIVVVLIILGIIFYTHKRIAERSSTAMLDRTVASVETTEDIEVPILASFLGVRWLSKIIGFAHNNANPRLILRQDSVEYKVFRTIERQYGEIEKVDVMETVGTKNVVFYFKNKQIIFSANIGNKIDLNYVLAYLKNKDVTLTPEAENQLIPGEL